MQVDIRNVRGEAAHVKHTNLHLCHPRRWPRQTQDPTSPSQYATPLKNYRGSYWQNRSRLLRLRLPHSSISSPKEKSNSPATPTSLITIRGITTTKKLYLSSEYTSTLCGGLTEGLNWDNICHNPSCMATKHPSAVTGSLLPFHAYLILTGSYILRPFPLLC